MAAIFDFSVDQGSTKRFSFVWKYNAGTELVPDYQPYSLAGCTARMQVRQGHGKPVLVAIDTTTTDGNIVLEAGALTGRVDVWLSDENTDLLDVKTTHYDLEIEFPSGDVYRVLQGKITSSLSITQAP